MDSDSDRSLQQAASLDLENGRAIRGYVCAVSMASMAYMMVVARTLSGDPDLSSLGVVLETFFRGFSFWIATLVAAILPVAVADRLARWFRISSIFYYLICGAVIGSALTILYIWSDIRDYPGRPFAPPAFLEAYIWAVPTLIAIGGVGGVTFWYKAGRYLSANPMPRSGGYLDFRFRRIAIATGLAICLFLPALIVSPIVKRFWFLSHCIVETRQKISNSLGFDFEATHTVCNTPARPTWVSVSGSLTGQGEKIRLFEFIPDKDDDTPTISVTDSSHIVISIPVVSSVRLQMHDWGNVHIEYRIGRVIYE